MAAKKEAVPSNEGSTSVKTNGKKFPYHSVCFLLVILAIIGLYCFHVKSSIKELRNTHEKIVLIQNSHIVKLDSAFCKFDQKCFDKIEYNINSMLPHLSQNDSTLLIKTFAERDSVVKSLLIGLIQKNNYSDFLSSTSLLHEELREGSSNIERVLELHLNKVEHEYANITIWAAVLTILFLVFSFYSLFRLEELKKEAEGMVDTLENKANELGSFSEIIDTKIQGIKEEVDAQINPIKEKSQNDFQNKIDEYQSKFDQLLKDYTNLLNEINKERVQASEKDKKEGES